MTDYAARTVKTREDQIQFLRFIMFLFVCFFHTGMWGAFRYPDSNGAVSAVSFFFMLSGTLCGFYARDKQCEFSVKNITADVFRRGRKLYGLYFITTIFAIFWSDLPAMILSGRFSEVKQSLFQLGCHLLMIQSWFPQGYFSYNGISWYLSSLMFLYLLNLPLTALLKKIDSMPKRKWISIGGMVICFGLTTIYSYFSYTENAVFWHYIFPPARIGQYIFGAFLGYYIRSVKDRVYDGRMKLFFFTVTEIGALLFWLVSLYLCPMDSWHLRLVDWFLPNMLLLGIFFIGKGGVSRLFRMKGFVKLGNVSADCYLIHLIVYNLFIALSGVTPVSRLDNLLCVGFPLCFTLLLAFYFNGNKAQR